MPKISALTADTNGRKGSDVIPIAASSGGTQTFKITADELLHGEDATGTAAGVSVTLRGGDAVSGVGGSVYAVGGTATSGTGGTATLAGGNGELSAGDARVKGGDAVGSYGVAGNVIMQGGDAVSHFAGRAEVRGGQSSFYLGGGAGVYGGQGDRFGGPVVIQGGSAPGTAGVGGNVTIAPGNAVTDGILVLDNIGTVSPATAKTVWISSGHLMCTPP
jgi:hypothetical protein